MKSPTLKQKVEMYEDFLHKINLFVMCGNNEGISELIQNADTWSYMHRVGNGEVSDKKQRDLINSAFLKLCDTPNADKATKERQRKWTEAQRRKEQAFMQNV